MALESPASNQMLYLHGHYEVTFDKWKFIANAVMMGQYVDLSNGHHFRYAN